ncbi:unnamed protein product, partial [Cladocopium goreaui]
DAQDLEPLSVFPAAWFQRYLTLAGYNPAMLDDARQTLRVFGGCEGAGTSAYIANYMQKMMDIPAELSFTSECDAEARAFCLRHQDWSHYYNDIDDDHAGGHCYVCGEAHAVAKRRSPVEHDLMIIGIPCPLFSNLNMHVRRDVQFNPFEQPTSRVVKSSLRKIRFRNPKAVCIEEVASLLQPFKPPLEGEFKDYKAPIDFFLNGVDPVTQEKYGLALPEAGYIPYHIKVLTLRSSQYGSPNCRKRCYILACRKDIIDPLSFMAMCHFAEHIAPHAHQGSASLTDCWAFCERSGSQLTFPSPAQDGSSRSSNDNGRASARLQAVLKQLGLPSSGQGPFIRSLSRGQRQLLNQRELIKLEVEHARLKKRGVDINNSYVDIARSAQQSMGAYLNGRGAAFSTSMKLFHLGKKAFLPAQALLAGQGFDPRDFLWSGSKYNLLTRLAGNGMTTSVVGACFVGLILYCYPFGDDAEPLKRNRIVLPPSSQWCWQEVDSDTEDTQDATETDTSDDAGSDEAASDPPSDQEGASD